MRCTDNTEWIDVISFDGSLEILEGDIMSMEKRQDLCVRYPAGVSCSKSALVILLLEALSGEAGMCSELS